MTAPLLLMGAPASPYARKMLAVMARAKRVGCEIDGHAWSQNPFPCQAKCVRWLHEEFTALSPTDQAAAMETLEPAGCSAQVR